VDNKFFTKNETHLHAKHLEGPTEKAGAEASASLAPP